METIFCLIKFGHQEFINKLLEEGEIYFNLPTFFNDSSEKERGDDNEGAEWIDNTKLANIRCDHPTLGTFEFKPVPNSPFRIAQYNYYYLSFSLYAITSQLFDKGDTHKIDCRVKELGDTAVVIGEPYTLLNAIAAELKSQGLRYEMNSVIYRDLTDGRVDLLPFDKKQDHQHQCEFRVIIENTDNVAKTIKIGSIEKYSKLFSSQSIIESDWIVNRQL